MLGVKASVVAVVIGALSTVTLKMGLWLQQIPETTPEISVQKNRVLAKIQCTTAKILCTRQATQDRPQKGRGDFFLTYAHTYRHM